MTMKFNLMHLLLLAALIGLGYYLYKHYKK
jgi:hypothetical protein